MGALTIVLGALGGGGLLAGLTRLVVQLVRERRLTRVTNRCLDGKNKADRENAFRVLQILQQAGDHDAGIQQAGTSEQQVDAPAVGAASAPESTTSS